MKHEVIAAYGGCNGAAPFYVCRCLAEGNRFWLEDHLASHASLPRGAFLQFVNTTADARSVVVKNPTDAGSDR